MAEATQFAMKEAEKLYTYLVTFFKNFEIVS
jgi:hypothetical protein